MPEESQAPEPESDQPEAEPSSAVEATASEAEVLEVQEEELLVELEVVSVPRPGWVTFAAVIAFVIAGIAVVQAIFFLLDLDVFYDVYRADRMVTTLWYWGVIDIIIAMLACYAGWDILTGGWLGRIIALIGAGLSIVRWMVFLPFVPATAVVIIAIDVLVIYALLNTEANEYFDALA